MLRRLAEIAHNPVVLEDSAHQIVEFAVHATAPNELLDAWEAHSRSGHKEEGTGRVHSCAGSPSCLWASIRLRGKHLGRVHLLQAERQFAELDRLALDRAVAALAFTLMADAETDHLADRACKALISDILVDRHGEAQDFFKRASACRAALQGRRLAAIVVMPRGLATLAAELSSDESERQDIRELLLRETRSAISATSNAGVCGLDRDRVLAVVGVDQSADLRARARRDRSPRLRARRQQRRRPLAGGRGEQRGRRCIPASRTRRSI